MNTPFTVTCQTPLACLVLFLMKNSLKMTLFGVLLLVCGDWVQQV
jgi:hypothetical protein